MVLQSQVVQVWMHPRCTEETFEIWLLGPHSEVAWDSYSHITLAVCMWMHSCLLSWRSLTSYCFIMNQKYFLALSIPINRQMHARTHPANSPVCYCQTLALCKQEQCNDMCICILSGEVRSGHKWSLKTHVETHSNNRCELMYLKMSTCDRNQARLMSVRGRTGPKTRSLQRVTCPYMYAVLSRQNSELSFDFEAPLIWCFWSVEGRLERNKKKV